MVATTSRRVFTILVGLVLLCGLATSGRGFWLIGSVWPFGSSIQIQLALGPTSVALQDGSGTWNNSAAAALELWNQQLQGVKFAAVPTSGTTGVRGDGANTAFFSASIYGEAFDSRTLAVTLIHTTNWPTVDESDVIFNSHQRYNAYRGPLQASGNYYTYDFQRVALHEFGHVLGLDHPDEHNQTVVAIMNSVISDLDHLAQDDLDAIRYIYPFSINSWLGPINVSAGNPFNYQVVASRSGASFGASGLPAGLQIDSATGVISGRPTTAGTYDVSLSATIGAATASATLRIVVTPPAITSGLNTSREIGKPMTYRITATNSPTSFSASGLPSGLQLDTATGLITGTPTTIGKYVIQLTATGSIGDARGTLTLVVVPPYITSALVFTMQVGVSGSYRITASNQPTGFSASGLPPGLTLNAATGVISGTPTKPGTYSVKLIAFGKIANATATVQLDVPAPWVTSSGGANVLLGKQFSYRITATSPPLNYSAVGLPPGLELNTKTGVISGIPTISGTYRITVIAHTAYGDASAVILVTATAPPPPLDTPAASWHLIVTGTPVADPQRPRMYVATSTGIAVVDTDTLTVTTIATASTVRDLTVSVDGRTLWFIDTQGSHLGRVDLDTLTPLSDLPVALWTPVKLRAGLGEQLYVTDFESQRAAQVDGATGAVTTLWSFVGSDPQLELSPDRRTLYIADSYGQNGYPDGISAFARFDVSTATPHLLQQITQTNNRGRKMLVPHSGATVELVDWGFGEGSTPYIRTVRADDITQTLEQVARPVEAGGLGTLSPDDSLMFLSTGSLSVAVVDTKSWHKVRTINVGGHSVLDAIGVDRTGTYLFVVADTLRAYRVKQPPPVAPPHSLLNVSTRLRTAPGDHQMIGGFIISGTAPKRVAVRAIGPSLGTAATLADPAVELYDSAGALLARNDNWNSTRKAVVDTGIAPANEYEAAIVASLAPGSYTAVVSAANNSSGIALVEVYDLDAASSSLANISTRGFVGTGESVMIAGFILGGDQPTPVLVRAVGPSLTESGIHGALLDSTLELYDANGGRVAQNDDWRSDQPQAIAATGVAPADDRESAILLTVPPGSYTAVVRGKNEISGIGLVEVYNLSR